MHRHTRSPGRDAQALQRPLIGVVLAFIAGTALALYCHVPVVGVLIAAAVCLAVVIVGEQRGSRWSTIGIFVAVCLAGMAGVSVRQAWPSARETAVAQLDRQAPVDLRIYVSGDPTRYLSRAGRPAWSVPAKVRAWRDPETGEWHAGRGRLIVRWRLIEGWPAPRYGDLWDVHGRFYDMGDALPAGVVERVWALRTRRRMTGLGNPWIACCYAWRRAAADRLAAGLDRYPEHVAVIQALLLGLRQRLSPALHQRFSATGTLHVMAISGLHVGVMTGLLVFALQTLGLSRTRWFYFLAPLLMAYTLATGARPSAVRACIMALAYWSALPLRRRPDAPSALALAALLILGYDPRQLTSPGFLFSFTAVAGLLVFFDPLNAVMMRPIRARGLYTPRVPGPGILRRELGRVATAGMALVTVSMIAWLMAAPLSAYFFGRISLIALPTNLLVVPLALLIVVTGCLSIVAGAVVPFVGIIFNHTNLVWTHILLRVLNWFAGRPGAGLPVSIPWWTIPLWYASLLTMGLRWMPRVVNRHPITDDNHEKESIS